MPDNKLSVTVRMYRQGLGDCFLLTFRQKGKSDFNMMIDCGLFLGTDRGKEIMDAVAKDIKTSTKGRIDVVALTHEHWDHISGFALAQKTFKEPDFKFGEVWVGWTENPEDPKFDGVRERFQKKKKGLRAALKEMESKLKSEKSTAMFETASALVNEFFGEGNSLGMSGADAWKYVLEKSDRQPPRYFSPGEIHTLDGVEGVRIYVLGPPEDFELLDDEESPEAETYRKHLRMAVTNGFLAAATGNDNSEFDANAYMPFDDKCRVSMEEAEDPLSFDGFFCSNYGFADSDHNSWRQIDDDWLSMAGELALNIDGITNNTCLALAIELVESKKVLIFPGDAQFGNWMSWQKLKWEVLDASGNKTEVNVNDLLKRTVLYKVGHHGSHNATLKKSGLELMESPDLVAMIPTNQQFALNKKTSKTPNGWKMPEMELLERLEQRAKGRVILADEAGEPDDDKKPLRERCEKGKLSPTDSTKFLGNVVFGGSFVRSSSKPEHTEPLYVEYKIEG